MPHPTKFFYLVHMERHIMIKHDYSPYDASKSDYFILRDDNYKQPPLL